MIRKNNILSFPFLLFGAALVLALGFTLGRSTGEITPGSIDGAAELIGLSFTPQEKDSMVGSLTAHRTNFQLLRSTSLENSVGPSLVFNPLPQGFYPDQNQQLHDWGLPK